VNAKRYILTTYDKRDDFPFKTRSFPDATGNIHITKTHSVIMGQLHRYKESNTHYTKYRERVQVLTNTLLEQGFERAKLGERIGKYYEENEEEIDNKYRISGQRFVEESFEKEEEKKRNKKKSRDRRPRDKKKKKKKEDKHEEENQT
jgi:hypothetical protein